MKKKQKAEPERYPKGKAVNSRNSSGVGLTFSEKKRLIQLKHILSGKSNEKEKPTTAQKTITFEKMFRDGICQVSHHYYTKMVEFFDINYSLLEVDEQADILAQYSKLINYFDPSVRFELVLFNRQVNEQMLTEQFDIPWQEDDFNDIREEYTEMLKKQAAKGNNGIIKSKYLIFGVESNGYKEAKSRLNNIEKDVIRNLNNIGTLARGLDGKERLRILFRIRQSHLSAIPQIHEVHLPDPLRSFSWCYQSFLLRISESWMLSRPSFQRHKVGSILTPVGGSLLCYRLSFAILYLLTTLEPPFSVCHYYTTHLLKLQYAI